MLRLLVAQLDELENGSPRSTLGFVAGTGATQLANGWPKFDLPGAAGRGAIGIDQSGDRARGPWPFLIWRH